MPRLAILTDDEIDSLYAIPKLDNEEQSFLFELDDEDTQYLAVIGDNTAVKIDYILQLGYFRALNHFFQFSFQKVKGDVAFILHHYFPDEPFPKKQIPKNQHYINRRQLISKYGLKEPDGKFQDRLMKEAKVLARRHSLSRYVLDGLLVYCQQHNVIRPAYSRFQVIVSNALQEERHRLAGKLRGHADKELSVLLDKLLENDDLFYNLTLIKKDQKNFTTTEIKKTIAKQQLVIRLYKKSLTLIPLLEISEQNIAYYANLAEFYTIQKLKRMADKNTARLYLLCYVHRRSLKINDHLVTSFTQKLSHYTDKADEYQRANIDVSVAMDKQLRGQAWKIMAINIDERIPDEKVRSEAFGVVGKDAYPQFLVDFKKPNLDRDYFRWQFYGEQALTIKKNIRPLFKTLEFSCADAEMAKAIDFLRQCLDGRQSFRDTNLQDIPMRFFPKTLRKFLIQKVQGDKSKAFRSIDSNRYECMVYLQLRKGLGDGTVFVKDSLSHRALEDELIDVEYWEKNKRAILAELNMPLLSTDILAILDQLQANLKAQYADVNLRINQGENTSLKVTHNRKGELARWTLPYNRLDDGMNNPFFEKLPVTSVSDILKFTAGATGFMSAFNHIQPKYAKLPPDPEAINACIISAATGIEAKKMKQNSDAATKTWIGFIKTTSVNKRFMPPMTP
jgi:Domain of unknown function (DUF4158)/Tn3 transposase DDE domain